MRISNIEIANVNQQSVAVGSNVQLGTIVRRYSCKCQPMSYEGGDTLTLSAPGYYLISFEATYQGAATGALTFAIESNGMAIPYATSTETIGASTGTITDGVSTIVRVLPNSPVKITIGVLGVGATVLRSDLKGLKIA